MFKQGDTVMYGSHGVCCVTDVREETFGPVRRMYYVLQPKKDARSTFYCPVAQEERLRALLTKDEVLCLIREMPLTDIVWEEDDNARRERFAAVLKSGDHREVVRLIKTLYQQRRVRAEQGKRLHLADERMMQEAERLLYEEIAYVMDIPPDKVVAYIEETLE